jgi:hypothetical protein
LSGALSREVQDGRDQQHLLLILIPENLGGWFNRTLLGFVFAVEAKSVITLESDFSGTQTLIKRLYGSLEVIRLAGAAGGGTRLHPLPASSIHEEGHPIS